MAEAFIGLEEAIWLIPKSKGKFNVQQFINACNLAIHEVEVEKYVFLLIKYVVTKLFGKALEAVRY